MEGIYILPLLLNAYIHFVSLINNSIVATIPTHIKLGAHSCIAFFHSLPIQLTKSLPCPLLKHRLQWYLLRSHREKPSSAIQMYLKIHKLYYIPKTVLNGCTNSDLNGCTKK